MPNRSKGEAEKAMISCTKLRKSSASVCSKYLYSRLEGSYLEGSQIRKSKGLSGTPIRMLKLSSFSIPMPLRSRNRISTFAVSLLGDGELDTLALWQGDPRLI
jgi:hypothetical protein